MLFGAASYEGGCSRIARTTGVFVLSDPYADGAPNMSSCRTLPSEAAQWFLSDDSSDHIEYPSRLTASFPYQRTQGVKVTAAHQRLKTCVSRGVFLR